LQVHADKDAPAHELRKRQVRLAIANAVEVFPTAPKPLCEPSVSLTRARGGGGEKARQFG